MSGNALPNGWMLWPEYVRRHGTCCVSSVSFGVFSLILCHSVSDSNVIDEPLSITCVAGLLHTLIVHTFGLTVSQCGVLVLYTFNAYVSLHSSASVRHSGYSTFATKLVFAVVDRQTFAK